jgi:hypothetical protein
MGLAAVACGDDEGEDDDGGGGEGPGGNGGAGGATTHDVWTLEEAWTAEVPSAMLSVAAVSGADDGVFVLGGNGASWLLARLDADGELADGWPATLGAVEPGAQPPRIAALADGEVLVAESRAAGWKVTRLDAAGAVAWTRDHAIGGPAAGIVVLPDGAAVFGTDPVGPAYEQQPCVVVRYGADGDEEDVFTVSSTEDDPAQLVTCDAGDFDADSGEIVLRGRANVTLAWTAYPIYVPSLLRMTPDFGGARTERDVLPHPSLDTGYRADLVALGDGNVVLAERDDDYRDHPISVSAIRGATTRSASHAGRMHLAALDAPKVAFVRQVQRTDEIETRLLDAPSGVELASASLPRAKESRLVDASGSGDAMWVAWSAWNEASVERGFVTRYVASATVEEGPAPEPPAPEPTHEIVELKTINAYLQIASERVVDLAAAPDGSLYFLGRTNSEWAVERFDADGVITAGAFPYDVSFPMLDVEGGTPARPAIAAMPDGSAVVAHAGSYGWRTTHLLANGTVDWDNDYDTGPEDFTAGVVVDPEGRVVVLGSPGSYQGIPHQDCWAIRYDANGDFDDTFEVAITESSPEATALHQCRAAAFDTTTGDVLVAGSVMVTDPFVGPWLGRGVKRVGDGGAVAAADDDLFGPVLGYGFEEITVLQNNLVTLGDGTVVAALSAPSAGMFATHRLALIAPDGAETALPWQPGVVRIAALDGDLLLVAHQAHMRDPIHVEVARIVDGALVVVGSTEVPLAEDVGHLVALSAVGDGTAWLSWQSGSNTDMLMHFAVQAR